MHDSDIPRFEGLRLLVDPAPHAGVLPALLHGLRSASGQVCMIVAGDMPFVQRSAFEYVLRVQCEEHASIVIPRVDGFLQLQPMHAVVDRHAAMDAIEVGLARGEQRLFRVLEPLGLRIVEAAELREVDPQLLTLFNVNTADDMARAAHIACGDVS